MTTQVWAIDPGTARSALVIVALDGERIVHVDHAARYLPSDLLAHLRAVDIPSDAACVVEQAECYGMPAGRDLLETVHVAGRMAEAWWVRTGRDAHRVPRRDVKLACCGTARATDATIRRAMIDIYGGTGERCRRCKGRGATRGVPCTCRGGWLTDPGVCARLAADEWAAFALAHTWVSQRALVM